MQEYAEIVFLISPVGKTWQNIYKTFNVTELLFSISPGYSGRKKINIALC